MPRSRHIRRATRILSMNEAAAADDDDDDDDDALLQFREKL